MPTYEVTSPDGKTWDVTAPEGATQDQVIAYAQKQWAAQPKAKPAVVQAGAELNQIPRQIGLTARYALEGLGQAAELVTEPIRTTITDPLSRKLGLISGSTKPMGQAAAGVADSIGLPKPETATERVVADASRMVAGSGGVVGAAGKLANLPGMVGKAGAFMAQNPASQLVSAAGAGAGAGASREAGGTPGMQAVAGLVGGLAAPAAWAGARRGVDAVSSAAKRTFAPQMVEKQVDNQIRLTLQRSGVDWNDVEASVRAQVRKDVADSLKSGSELSGDALRRLIEFRRVGATPTAGSLSLDPVQITREKNLAKLGANSSDPTLQRLAQVENQNNAAFIRNLNESGASRAPDPLAVGETLIGSLQGRDAAARQQIGALYSQARDSGGRSAQLDGAAFTQRANQLLQENLAGKLPSQIESALNDIAMGKVPLTVDHAEQLKTVLGRIQRNSSDGNERYAMGLIRQALENTPLRSGNAAGQQAMEAFSRARAANRSYMGELERNPALAAAIDGAAPDNFFSKFVLRGNAGDAQALRDSIAPQRLNPQNLPATAEQIRALPAAQSAQALDMTKNAIVDHLKKQALGGAADEVGNFSQAAYNKALRDIGDRKLALFFSPEEITQLKAVGRVSSYTQLQPRGSAVNNSNSGALLGGLGLDFLSKYASRVPLGLNDTITGVINGTQARQALTPGKGLLAPEVATPLADLIGPQIVVGGGLLAPQLLPNR